MIDIKNIQGGILKSVLETQDCVSYDGLQEKSYVQLSWNDAEYMEIPAGSYIEHNGKTYRLMQPYVPLFIDAASYRYTPQFFDEVAFWGVAPFFLITEQSEETDWTLTAYPGLFMDAIVKAIKKYTGDTYTYSVDASIAQDRMETLTFQNVSIFDGLNSIASKFNTEWWVEGNNIHLSKCQYGTETELTVGGNINIPSLRDNKSGYYTRYYAFGSTRNITQDFTSGEFTNSVANKRLTLDQSKYPGGYIDVRDNLQQGEIFVKTLVFDDIYPSSNLTISAVNPTIKDYLDTSGNPIQVGVDEEGKPIYRKYTVWRFSIDGFEFNDTTYDEVDNPEGMLLPGLNLSVSFESGQLNDRDFQLTYIKDTKEYEINFVQEGDLVIPGTTSLIPAVGDEIILYNIRMPQEYVTSAQQELADAVLKRIEEDKKDTNNRTFSSNPVAFFEQGLDMKVGMAVSLVRAGNAIFSRVLSVKKNIDKPEYQTIEIGAQKIKGSREELKEEIINANQNIDEVKALADVAKAISDGYWSVQQAIIESLSQYRGIWRLDKRGFETDPTKWVIITDYNAISAKDFVAYGVDSETEDVPFPVASYNMQGILQIKQGSGLIINDGLLSIDPDYAGGGGLDIEALEQYLTDNKYYNSISKLTGYTLPEKYTAITAEDTILSAFGKLEKNFSNYVDLFTDQTIDGVKTFKKTIFGQQDIVCYAVDNTVEDVELPIASANVLGLVKVGEGLNITADGTLSAVGGGGVNFTPGTGLNLTSANVLEVVFGTTSTTVCRGNDSRLSDARRNPYSLSWSGYSSGSYDGSSAASISIPSNTNQLTNGAGFIYDGNRNFTSLSGSGDNTQYLAGDGSFYTIRYSELSGTPDLSLYVKKAGDTMTGNLTIDKSSPTLYLSGSRTWGIREGSGDLRFLNNGTLAAYFSGVNNGTLAIKGDLIADGDVICYAVGDAADVEFSVSWSDITGKPSWIGSTKPSYSWSEITGKPSWIGSSKPTYTASEVGAISSITYSTSGSGKVVTSVSANGRTVSVTYGNVSGGSDWNGGTVDNNIVVDNGSYSSVVLRNGSNNWGIYWGSGTDFAFKKNGSTAGYFSGSNFGTFACVKLVETSDMNLKNIIGDVAGVLENISKIPIVYFTYKTGSKTNIGSLAQKIEPLFPELVYHENGQYYLNYSQGMSCLAIQGVKELYQQMKNINLWQRTKDEQIKQLQQDNLALKARIEVLEKGGNV